MKSEYQIYMDFKRANDVADELRSIARSTRGAANQDLQGALSRIRSSWEGENSDAFQMKGERLRQQVEQLAEQADKAAKLLTLHLTRFHADKATVSREYGKYILRQ